VISGRALVNLSALSFLAIIGFLFASSRREEPPSLNKAPLLWALVPTLAGLLVYAHTLGYAFVFDDYVHLGNALTETASAMLERVLWRHPQGQDVFFRPVGYISYWLNFRWAALSPTAWHAYCLVLHLLNVCLVFVLSRKLFAGLLPPLTASLVFALHGAHVEAVCWLAAQFDLLATLFVLLALIFSLSRNAVLVAACAIFACLSKESAYALPFLVVCTTESHLCKCWMVRACLPFGILLPALVHARSRRLSDISPGYRRPGGTIFSALVVPVRTCELVYQADLVDSAAVTGGHSRRFAGKSSNDFPGCGSRLHYLCRVTRLRGASYRLRYVRVARALSPVGGHVSYLGGHRGRLAPRGAAGRRLSLLSSSGAMA
jgi:hypothetical protein